MDYPIVVPVSKVADDLAPVLDKNLLLMRVYHIELEWWIATDGKMESVDNVNLKALFQDVRDIIEGMYQVR